MSDTQKERKALKDRYPSKDFAKKVDSMSNAQVMAIYLRLKTNNKL